MREILFPFARPPDIGNVLEVASGVFWLRLPLPFRLDHVNVYLLEGPDEWTVVDAGVDDAATRAIWDRQLATLLSRKPVTRLIATHFHPDHLGAASFLCGRTGARLLMGEIEYLTAKVLRCAPREDIAAEQAFYRSHGLGAGELGHMAGRFARYRRLVPALPPSYRPLRAGDRLRLGARIFDVLLCPGHSPGQVVLASPDLLFAADHVMVKISPNVSVAEDKPEDDPLGAYLESFEGVCDAVRDDALVLPGHRLPFRGLRVRTSELALHHADRCGIILRACAAPAPLSVAELVPVLFPMELDEHQFAFAFSEALAHVTYLARRKDLVEVRAGTTKRWRTASPPSRRS